MKRCTYYDVNRVQCDIHTDKGVFCFLHEDIEHDPVKLLVNTRRSKSKIRVKLKPISAKYLRKYHGEAQGLVKGTATMQDEQHSEVISREQCLSWLSRPAINPLTGRLININGPTFKKLQKACLHYQINVDIPEGDLKDIYGCNNDIDPVMGMDFNDMDDSEIADLIKLGSGNCYMLDTLHGWYKSKVQDVQQGETVEITDPMRPDYKLTDMEIAKIDEYMLANDSTYTKPIHKVPARPPPGYHLIIDQDWINVVGFHKVKILRPNGSTRVIGTLPMRIEDGGINSYVVYERLFHAWEKGVLMLFNNPEGTTGIPLLDDSRYTYDVWWNSIHTPVYPFDPLTIDVHSDIIRHNLSELHDRLNDRIGGVVS